MLPENGGHQKYEAAKYGHLKILKNKAQKYPYIESNIEYFGIFAYKWGRKGVCECHSTIHSLTFKNGTPKKRLDVGLHPTRKSTLLLRITIAIATRLRKWPGKFSPDITLDAQIKT